MVERKVISARSQVVLVLVCLTSCLSSATVPLTAGRALPPQYGQVPVTFVANAGQTNPLVRFVSGAGIPVFFTDTDVRLLLKHEGRQSALFLELLHSAARIEARSPVPTTVSFFSRSASAVNLPAFREVVYRNAWPGIDAAFRDDGGRLSYEFLLAPGANVNNVRLRVGGADQLSLDADGNLHLSTPLGTIVDTAPRTYQVVGGERRLIESRFALIAEDTIGFTTGDYDRALPLLIDPSIVYSTFLGGPGHESGNAIALDGIGAAYIAGHTTSSNFPLTPGVVDSTRADVEGFVAKLSPDGRTFEYVTYLGGSGADEIHGIAVDGAGNAYVTGITASTDFPVTAGALRTTKGNATALDGFVAKLNPTATALSYSTYLGGNAQTLSLDIVVDGAGQAHVVGGSAATNLPTTANAIRRAPADQDGFLLKLNAGGTGVLYGSYLGGSAHDSATGVSLDSAGYVYVTGFTTSPDLSTTSGAYDRSVNPGGEVYAAKVNTSAATAAAALVYGTYLNTHGGGTIAVDPQTQAAYIGGFGSVDNSPRPSTLLLKLNPSGSALEYKRRVGPERVDSQISAVAVDENSNVFVGGFYDDTVMNAFVSRVDAQGLEASRANVDGLDHDVVYALAVDRASAAYVTGNTSSANFPVSASAAQPRLAGETDAFAAKVSFADVPTTNVAEDRAATSLSIEAPQYAPAAAFDGDFATRWSSAFSDPQWIAVDLGQRYRVERVALHWETAYGAEYELHISDDGLNWYPLRSSEHEFGWSPARDGGVDNHVSLNGTGRYVRMFGRKRGTQWGYSLWEMQVFGTPVSTPAPAPGTVNLARGAPVGVSSIESVQLQGAYAVDVNLQTRWSSAFADPQWIWVDLGAVVNVSRVVLRWETAYGRDYQIQVSDDLATWTSVRTVTNGDGGVDDLTNLSARGRYVRMHGTVRGTQWGYSLWEFEVYGVINDGSSPPPPPPPPASSEIVLYADDVASLHNLSLVADATAAGGRKISSVDAGWSSTERPPAPNTAPYAIFAINVRERGTYRLWMRLRGQGDSKFNESVWVQYRTTIGTSPYPWGTTHGLLVNLENCSGCGIQNWGWQDNSWWLSQPSAVLLETGVHFLYVTLREDGVEFDQIVLSKQRYLNEAPGPVKNDGTTVPQPADEIAEAEQGTLVIDEGNRGTLHVTGPEGFSLDAGFSTALGNTVGGIWECGPDCQPGEEVSLFGRWLGGDFSGTATWRGTTYTNLGSQASNSSAELVLGGSVRLPPASSNDQVITVPFAAAGQMQLADATSVHHVHYRGGGTVTLTLQYTAATNSWSVRRADFVFTP